MSKRTEFILMMHHAWKDFYRDKDAGIYNLDEAWGYFEQIESGGDASPTASLTTNGRKILDALKKMPSNNVNMWTAKEIADTYDATSASVSGGMRKLISDGYVEKGNPGAKTIFYKLTAEGLAI